MPPTTTCTNGRSHGKNDVSSPSFSLEWRFPSLPRTLDCHSIRARQAYCARPEVRNLEAWKVPSEAAWKRKHCGAGVCQTGQTGGMVLIWNNSRFYMCLQHALYTVYSLLQWTIAIILSAHACGFPRRRSGVYMYFVAYENDL